jgi:vacuolar protein sorting-associated protein 29
MMEIYNTINCLVIGDAHIPDRNSFNDIPKLMIDKIKSLDINEIFYTGDFTESKELFHLFMNSINNKTDNFHIVQGNMDGYYSHIGKTSDNIDIKKYRKIIHTLNFQENTNQHTSNHSIIRVGVIHGHQVHPRGDINQLIRHAERMDVDILLSGHTHMDSIDLCNNILLINPGSATGAWSFLASKIPTFVYITLEYQPSNQSHIFINVHFYSYPNREKEVHKINSFQRLDTGKIIQL